MYKKLEREVIKWKKIQKKSLSDFDTSKNEIFEELKSANFHDLEYLVYGRQLKYNVIMDVTYIKCFPWKRGVYNLPPGIYETSVINKTLEYLLPDIVKVIIAIDDIRLGSS